MIMFNAEQRKKAKDLLALCREKRLMIATAESCTGGLIAALLTEIAGSSDVFERGFVTYANRAKEEMLGVRADILAQWGAVSPQTARAMAVGAIENAKADVSVAVTGIAGPGGGTAQKPVGLVYLAASIKAGLTINTECRFGDIGRAKVREATVLAALDLLKSSIEQQI